MSVRRSGPAGCAQVVATPFVIPYLRPLHLATGVVREHCAVLVEIADGDGERGIGEIAPGPGTTRAGATQCAARLAAAAATICAAVQENDPARLPMHALPPAERAGVEAALLDLSARRRRLPLHRLLMETPLAATVAVNAMLDAAAAPQLQRAVDGAVGKGYACLKFKAGPDEFAACIEALRYARQHYGHRLGLRVDGNRRWRASEALAALHQLEPLGIDYFEQPVAELAELRALRGATTVRIAADESAAEADQVDAVIATGAADVIVLKPARLGPLGALRAAGAACEAGIECVVTSNLETSVGVAAAAQVAAAVDAMRAGSSAEAYRMQPHRGACHGLGTVELLAGDITVERMLARTGRLHLPATPGCGVVLDAAALRRRRITNA